MLLVGLGDVYRMTYDEYYDHCWQNRRRDCPQCGKVDSSRWYPSGNGYTIFCKACHYFVHNTFIDWVVDDWNKGVGVVEERGTKVC